MSKNFSILALKIAVTLLLLYLIFSRTNFTAILAAISHFNVGLLVLLALLNVGAVCVSAVKWKMLLPEARLKDLATACFVSYYFSLLLPGQLAQEGAKAYYLDRTSSSKRSRIASSILVDKIVSIVGLLFVGCVGAIFSQRRLPIILISLFFVSTAVAILFLFSLRANWLYAAVSRWLTRVSAAIPRGKRIFDAGGDILESWHGYTGNLSLLFENLILGIVYQIIGILTFYLLARSLHLGISFFDWSWIVAALSLAILLPLTIGGLGIREGALIGLLQFYGAQTETAVGISLAVFFLMLILAAIGGILAAVSSLIARRPPTPERSGQSPGRAPPD
jgi:glycosyltransferase 2 family protein